MTKEIIETGKTVEEAVQNACEKYSLDKDDIQIEIIERAKKGFFGLKFSPAKVKVTYNEVEEKSVIAKEYLTSILKAMGVDNFKLEMTEDDNSISFTLTGDELGFIIGRRGETLDAIQYLTGLVANRIDGEYVRIVINSGNFREKREKTLQMLATKLAKNAIRTSRSTTLEPMNPYERRIIHAAVSQIDGAISKSVGEEPKRRVVISSKNARKRTTRPYNRDNNRDNQNRGGYKKYDKPYNKNENKPVQAVSEIKKNKPTEEVKAKPLYSKIEID